MKNGVDFGGFREFNSICHRSDAVAHLERAIETGRELRIPPLRHRLLTVRLQTPKDPVSNLQSPLLSF